MRYKRVLGGLCIATSVGVFLGFPASAIAQSIEESESKTGTGLYESAKRARAEGDLDSALELMRRSAIVSEDGGDIEDAAWARAVLSSWFLGKADAANVIAEQQHAISLFEQLDEGPRRYEGIANVSENAGRFNLTRGEIDEAFVDWKRAGEAFEKRLNKDEAAADDSELYMFLKRSVFLCIKMAKRRDDNSVFDGLKRLIQTFRHHPEMLLQLASALEQRANIRTDEKKHEDAIHLHDRRMDVLRILYGSENHLIASAQWERDHAEALSQLSSDDQVWSQKAKELRDGFVPLHTAGKFAELKDAGIQVMEIQRKTFGPDDYTVADAAHALGSAEIQMGNFQQAEKHFDKAARIIAQCFGKVHPIYANNRSSVAMVYERLGNRRKAIELYLEVDEILEATVGPQSNDYLLNQFNIGRLYREMGEWERSAKYVTDAFHAYRNSCSTDSLEFATALNEYAIVLQRQGDTDKAGELFVESMVIRVNQFGENHETVARSLNNIGNLLVESNSHADAIPFLEKSLTITESLGQSTSALQATVLFNLGWAIAVSGDHEKGEAILERCLTHAEKIYGTDSHQLVTECLQRLALLQWRKGRTESAADLLLRSARATRRSVEEFASILSDREHIEVNTRRREILDSLISIALAKPELQMEVSEELLKWKGSTTVRQTRMRQTK